MANDRVHRNLWILAATAAAIVPRFLWLSDMEFKGDELQSANGIANLRLSHWTPLAGISAHSGFVNSSGFGYLLHCLVPNGQPLSMVAAVAAFNAFAIVVPLWWLRRSPHFLFTFAMCGTSMALILGSRKIWAPDLQAPWVCLSIGLLGASLDRSRKWAAPFASLAAFCLVMAGHMYLPAVFVAAVGGIAVTAAHVVSKRWKQTAAWIIGAIAGWATFIPWAVMMVSGAPGTRGASSAAREFRIAQWVDSLKMGLTLPTPYNVYTLYLEPSLDWMFNHRPSLWLNLTLAWIAVACVIAITLFAAAIWSAITCWRDAIKDPLLLTAIALFVAMPVALFTARLGTYLHYWFAVIPFFYYWIAWAVTQKSRLWQKLTVAACVASLLADVCFAGLVHENRGLPGEYGQSYSARGS